MRRLAVAVAFVAIAVAAVATFSPSGSASPRWTDDRVTVIGDSMAFDAAGELERGARGRGWTMTIHARPGTTFGDNLDEIAALAGQRESAVVIELGTNDALTGRRFTAREADAIDRAIESLEGVGCVLFVNAGLLHDRDADAPNPRFWDQYGRGARAARELNRHLAEAVDGRGNLHVFDWYTAFNDNVEWTRDLIHLKAEHQADYARLVLDALSDACGGGTDRP